MTAKRVDQGSQKLTRIYGWTPARGESLRGALNAFAALMSRLSMDPATPDCFEFGAVLLLAKDSDGNLEPLLISADPPLTLEDARAMFARISEDPPERVGEPATAAGVQ